MLRRFLITAAALVAPVASAQTFNIDIDAGDAPFGAGVPANAFGGGADAPGYWNDIDNVPGLTTTLRGLNGVLSGVTLQTSGEVIVQSDNDGSASGDFAKLMEDGWKCATASDSITCTISNLEAGAYFIYTYGDRPDSNTQQTRVTINGTFQNCGGSHNTNEFVNNVTHTRHYFELGATGTVVVTVTNNPNVGGSRAFLGGMQIKKLPRRIYVDGSATGTGDGLSWANACTRLQDGFGAAGQYGGAIDEIWVANGTYYPADVAYRGDTFDMPSNVAVYGGFAGGETTLSQRDPATNVAFLSGNIGGPLNGDNSYHVITAWDCGTATLLDGFTISSGTADSAIGWDDRGAGMYIRDSFMTVRNCRFIGNTAEHGGAIAVAGGGPRFVDCLFFLNDATIQGAAIYVASDNYVASTRIANCRFHGNESQWSGGAVHVQDGITYFSNSIFTGNLAEGDGGAIYLFDDSSPAYVRNCTFAGNTSYSDGGALYVGGGAALTMTNSIAWDNYAEHNTNAVQSQVHVEFAPAPTIQFTCLEFYTGALYGGIGNSGADPLFVDADGAGAYGNLDDNVRLAPGSPFIDAGSNFAMGQDYGDVDRDNNTFEAPPIDLDGNTRRVDDPDTADSGDEGSPDVDFGAYEFQPPCELAGDLDSDGDVDLQDLTTLLGHFGMQSGATPDDGDSDGDQDVDIADLAALLSSFGQVCP